LSFGAWTTWGITVDDEIAFQCMKVAFESGCNFFDNAEAYGQGRAEETMGKCIKRLNVKRSELVISTKIFWGGKGVNQVGLSRKHIIEGLNASLQRLQLDYVDLLFCHRPDPDTPIEETVRAMNFLINAGKVFYWGTSEWSADQIMEANLIASRLGLVGPVMDQPQYSMLHRTRVEKEYKRLYKEMGLGLTIWSPLASGLLTGKYSKNEPFATGTRLGSNNDYAWLKEGLYNGKGLNGLEEKNFDDILQKIDGLRPLAQELGCSLSQLAIAWCAKNPNVSTVITGASRVEQVVENFKSLSLLPKLTPAVMEKIDAVLKNKPTPEKEFK